MTTIIPKPFHHYTRKQLKTVLRHTSGLAGPNEKDVTSCPFFAIIPASTTQGFTSRSLWVLADFRNGNSDLDEIRLWFTPTA